MNNSITQNQKNTKRYLPHEIKTSKCRNYLNSTDYHRNCDVDFSRSGN